MPSHAAPIADAPAWSLLENELTSLSRTGMRLGLERMERALSETGDPHRAVPVLHVTGSNGKGSTCAFLERCCRASGLRTALYTSPHLERFTERFQVDGVPLPERVLLEIDARLRRDVPWVFEGPDALTFFERVTLYGFHALAAARPDVLVCEVGLGGRLDATNVVQPLVACVTPVGLEHKDFLGDSLEGIAREKAGILKRGAGAVSSRQQDVVLAVLEREAARKSVALSLEGREFQLAEQHGRLAYESDRGLLDGLVLGLRGEHQHSNAGVALRALELAREAGLRVTASGIEQGLAATRWPGRLESIEVARPGRRPVEVILDGAHNPPATEVLARALPPLLRGRRTRLVFGLLADKEAGPVLAPLAPLVDGITLTTPPTARAVPAARLEAVARTLLTDVQVVDGPGEALARALDDAGDDDVVLVAGSLYLVGALRAWLHGRVATGPGEHLRPEIS